MNFLKPTIASLLAAAASAQCGPEKMDEAQDTPQIDRQNDSPIQESQIVSSGKIESDATPAVKPSATLSIDRAAPGFTTSDSILPIAQIDTDSTEGFGAHSCLATYLEGGFLLTAAHCLRLPNGVSDCPDSIEIGWLEKGPQGSLVLSSHKTQCETVFADWRADNNPTDLALIRLEKAGTWPKAAMTPGQEDLSTGTGVVIFEPELSSQEFTLQKGQSLEFLGTQFTSSILSQKGSSGGPVFALADTENQRSPVPSIFYGIHVGTNATTTRSQHLRSIRQLISEYRRSTKTDEQDGDSRNQVLQKATGVE